MRATFQNKPGFLGLRLHLYIDFSEEEKAIIRTRALHGYMFDLSPGHLATIKLSRETSYHLATGSFFLFLAGMYFLFQSALHPSLREIAYVGLFGGPLLFVFIIFSALQPHPDNYVTIAYMLANPHLVIATDDPASTPVAEQNIQRRLSELKNFLTQTHGLVSRRTIDL